MTDTELAQPVAPQPRDRRLAVAAATVTLVVGIGIGFLIGHATGGSTGTSTKKSTKTSATATHAGGSINGDLSLDKGSEPYSNPNWTSSSDGNCSGDGGYSDLAGGASITVTDASGKVIAVGTLEDGSENAVTGTCDFSFSIVDVPRQPFYGIQVTHRGVVNFSQAEVDSGSVHLSIGT